METKTTTLPRITIKYCTQCKWMLRAAYFAQELLSTFSTDLGEVALIPATGGVFTVTMYHSGAGDDAAIRETVLWDRKTNGGFPEVKVLKSLVRNVVDPARDLGHTDRALRAANVPVQEGTVAGVSQGQDQGVARQGPGQGQEECQDCK
ncbi:Rdx family-domain-containing protein [Aspergillus ambiguus]|uniref:SelT/SelW/SelH family protein n=1 Tax=Aspergillus ambiguus TaxID=176160 RepID=UPI003CCD46E5